MLCMRYNSYVIAVTGHISPFSCIIEHRVLFKELIMRFIRKYSIEVRSHFREHEDVDAERGFSPCREKVFFAQRALWFGRNCSAKSRQRLPSLRSEDTLSLPRDILIPELQLAWALQRDLLGRLSEEAGVGLTAILAGEHRCPTSLSDVISSRPARGADCWA